MAAGGLGRDAADRCSQFGDAGAVLNGANLLAVELPSGDWELLQFRDAVLVDTDLYRLSMLLRGLRGTDAVSFAPIAAGCSDRAVDEAIVPCRSRPTKWD